MKMCGSLFASILFSWFLTGCAGPLPQDPVAVVDCSSLSHTTLKNYDQFTSEFLDEPTRHPTDNLDGVIIWDTRYYLESLITAFEATHNPKYLQAFEETGTSVMNQLQTAQVLDIADPSAPGPGLLPSRVVPTITAIGWPTSLSTFGTSITVPTITGAAALYAQSLNPTNGLGPTTLQITAQSDGSLQFDWLAFGSNLETDDVHSIADLNTIASKPLVAGQSIYRIKPSGIGLPAPGSYNLGTPLTTIWGAEQTGGILLPFARFLLVAKQNPKAVDAGLVTSWRTNVLQVAASYEDLYVPDGGGGYILRNAIWMPSGVAGLSAESDYVWVEISLRMLLFELGNDSKELALARGLLQHQIVHNIGMNPDGLLLLRGHPDIFPWSNRSAAPEGSIWDSYDTDPTAPETTLEAGFFPEMLHIAGQFGLTKAMGIPAPILSSQLDTFRSYLRIPNPIVSGINALLRGGYPTEFSTPSDSPSYGDDPFVGADYLYPETSDAGYGKKNWQWMGRHNTSPQEFPVGYFLRSWARSEAAALQVCTNSNAQN